VLSDQQRNETARLFAKHGFDGALRVARVTSDDERIFVVPPEALSTLPQLTLTTELQQTLGRKVWIVAAGPEWADTEPLR
jgi:hypothetical protein